MTTANFTKIGTYDIPVWALSATLDDNPAGLDQRERNLVLDFLESFDRDGWTSLDYEYDEDTEQFHAFQPEFGDACSVRRIHFFGRKIW